MTGVRKVPFMPDGSGRQHVLLRFDKSCVVFESRCMCILSRLLAWPPEVGGWLSGVYALEKGQRTRYYERNEDASIITNS